MLTSRALVGSSQTIGLELNGRWARGPWEAGLGYRVQAIFDDFEINQEAITATAGFEDGLALHTGTVRGAYDDGTLYAGVDATVRSPYRMTRLQRAPDLAFVVEDLPATAFVAPYLGWRPHERLDLRVSASGTHAIQETAGGATEGVVFFQARARF